MKLALCRCSHKMETPFIWHWRLIVNNLCYEDLTSPFCNFQISCWTWKLSCNLLYILEGVNHKCTWALARFSCDGGERQRMHLCWRNPLSWHVDGWHKDGQAQHCILRVCNMPRHDKPKLVKMHQEETFSFESWEDGGCWVSSDSGGGEGGMILLLLILFVFVPGANFTWFLFRVPPFLGPFFTLLLRLLEVCPPAAADLFAVRCLKLLRFMPFFFRGILLCVLVLVLMHLFLWNETLRLCLLFKVPEVLGLEPSGVLTFENASISSKAFTACGRLVLWDDPTRPIESQRSFNHNKHRVRFSDCT